MSYRELRCLTETMRTLGYNRIISMEVWLSKGAIPNRTYTHIGGARHTKTAASTKPQARLIEVGSLPVAWANALGWIER